MLQKKLQNLFVKGVNKVLDTLFVSWKTVLDKIKTLKTNYKMGYPNTCSVTWGRATGPYFSWQAPPPPPISLLYLISAPLVLLDGRPPVNEAASPSHRHPPPGPAPSPHLYTPEKLTRALPSLFAVPNLKMLTWLGSIAPINPLPHIAHLAPDLPHYCWLSPLLQTSFRQLLTMTQTQTLQGEKEGRGTSGPAQAQWRANRVARPDSL
jgi:hypothetical protein